MKLVGSVGNPEKFMELEKFRDGEKSEGCVFPDAGAPEPCPSSRIRHHSVPLWRMESILLDQRLKELDLMRIGICHVLQVEMNLMQILHSSSTLQAAALQILP